MIKLIYKTKYERLVEINLKIYREEKGLVLKNIKAYYKAKVIKIS